VCEVSRVVTLENETRVKNSKISQKRKTALWFVLKASDAGAEKASHVG